jgi:hypothetical protein
MGYPLREVINQRGTVSRGLETSVQSLVRERLVGTLESAQNVLFPNRRRRSGLRVCDFSA